MQHPARTHFPVKAEILLLVFKTQSRLWNLSDSSTYMASDSAQCQGWKMNDPKGREKITQIYEKKKDKKKKRHKKKKKQGSCRWERKINPLPTCEPMSL